MGRWGDGERPAPNPHPPIPPTPHLQVDGARTLLSPTAMRKPSCVGVGLLVLCAAFGAAGSGKPQENGASSAASAAANARTIEPTPKPTSTGTDGSKLPQPSPQ